MPRLTPLFVATTSVAVIVSAYLWQQLRTARESNDQMQDRITQLEIAQQRASRDEPARATTAMALPPVTAAVCPPAPAAMPPAPAAKTAPASAARSLAVSIRELLKDPDYREAQRAQMRMTMPQRYPDLAKELGLSPAETDALFDLLARQQVDQMAVTFTTDDSEAVRQETMRAANELARNQQNELESQLGPARYQQFKDYQQTLGARQQVSQLRTTLSTAGYPLSDDQAAPLLATLTAEQKRRTEELRARASPTLGDPRGQLDFQEQNLKTQEQSNQRVLDAAQSYLTADQLAALKGSLTQQLSLQRAFLKAQRAQLESGSGGSGGAIPVLVP
jgi:hypothetical protein